MTWPGKLAGPNKSSRAHSLALARVATCAVCLISFICIVDKSQCVGAEGKESAVSETSTGFSWEMPGRVSIFDLQFGPAILKNNQLNFLGHGRTFNAGLYGDRLTLMIRFSYNSTQPEVPLKFVIKLPESRQYEETIRLASRQGQYTYHFTIHNPKDFVGSGSVYLYYGFSIVDVLDFTIMPGS